MCRVQGGKQPYYDDEFDDKNDHPKERKKREIMFWWMMPVFLLTWLLKQIGGGDKDEDEDENDFESVRGKLHCWLLYCICLYDEDDFW